MEDHDNRNTSRHGDVFGLGQSQLKPVAEKATGEQIASYQVIFEHTLDGHCGAQGTSLVPTFIYRTNAGATGKVAVFAKRFASPHLRESHHYAYLQELSAPVPRMYGSSVDPEGCEIIFLEYLPKLFGDTKLLGRPVLYARFLALLGHFNSILVDSEYASTIRRCDLGGMAKQESTVLEQVASAAASGELGSELARLFSSNTLRVMERAAESLAAAVTDMKVGLIHGDFFPRHVGCRQGEGDLLTFDLAHAQLAPRFFDVATFIWATDDLPPRSLDREKAAEAYLSAFQPSQQDGVTLEAFLQETRDVWLAWNMRCLRWWLDQAMPEQTPGQEPEHLRAGDESKKRIRSYLDRLLYRSG